MKCPVGHHRKLVRTLGWLLPTLVLCVGLMLNFRGIAWARFHPDERLIVKWANDTEKQPFIVDRAYPGGFFELYRPIRSVEKLFSELSVRDQRWRQQRGRPKASPVRRRNILLGVRQTNAFFIALSSIFVFWSGRRIYSVVSKKGDEVQPLLFAGLAAFIYVVHPFLVEHAHYGETDGVMVLTGAIATALLTEALVSKRLRFFLLSAFMVGFSFGCKYTLIPLLFVLPVSAVVFARLLGWRVRRSGAFVLGAILLAGLGFCLATPSIYHDFAFFIRESRITSASTWGEMNGLLGRMHATPGAASAFKWQCFSADIAALGTGRVVWLLLAFPFWFVRPLRRHLCVFPFFTLSFLFSVVFIFPWFRNQELLPMLPVFSLTAVLPVAVLGFSRARPAWRNVPAILALLAVLAIAVANLMDGSKMASAFAGEESRNELGDWLSLCAPAGRQMGVERYADRPGGYKPVEDFHIGKIETQTANFFETNAVNYLMCSPRYRARGTVNPFTGTLYEDLADIRNQFNERSVLLKSWRLPEGRIRPIFSQIDVEMRFVNRNRSDQNATNCLEVCLDSPFVVNRGRYVHVAREDGYAVGPQAALHVAGKTSDVRFSGRHNGPWYGVAFVPQARADGVPGDAEVVWRTSGAEPRKARVPFKHSRLFTIAPSSSFSLFPKERVKFRGDESQAVCLLALYADPLPAARLLRRTGNPEACLELLTRAGADLGSHSAQVEAFLASSALDRIGEPSWRAAAERAAGVEVVTAVGGIPLDVLRDFSRFRFENIQLGIHDIALAESGEWLFEADLPMLLTPGRYTATLRFQMPMDDWKQAFGFPTEGLEFKMQAVGGDLSADAITFPLVNGLSGVLETTWVVSESVIPRLKVSVDAGEMSPRMSLPGLFVHQLEVVWDPEERVIVAQEEIRAALCR